ncbi:hypothetical protein J437_LFUL005048 [Ladona fulva]|uniref:Uncharacterized protein n=1 Tax=Ladona fulva TaxID=123851 RepID=A0A8K0KSF5_LADFU|nr:hypothetical protein J437_LFUL005048 [Ladona fulva]
MQEGNTRKLHNIGCFHTLIAYLMNGFMSLIVFAWINFVLTCITITCLFMGAVKSRAYNGPAKENILYYTLEER